MSRCLQTMIGDKFKFFPWSSGPCAAKGGPSSSFAQEDPGQRRGARTFCFPCRLPQAPFPPEAAHSLRKPGEAFQHLDHMEEIGVWVWGGPFIRTLGPQSLHFNLARAAAALIVAL